MELAAFIYLKYFSSSCMANSYLSIDCIIRYSAAYLKEFVILTAVVIEILSSGMYNAM
jgi:hypothetical protein